MFDGLTRPYKCNRPMDTIAAIRKILNSIDLFVYECNWCHPYKEIYSVSVISELKQGRFRTNGKGRTRQFCLASAYAEYVERIQNGILAINSFPRIFLNRLKEKSGFFFFPDEKIMTRDEFESLPQEYLDDIFMGLDKEKTIDSYFNRLKENGYEGCVAVPFRDVTSDRTVYLPYNFTQMLSGSNGMAAGNTFHEAVFQALCELLERYSASIIYYNQLTPPTISRDILEKFPREYAIIQDIEATGEYEVIIKDFSCNRQIPSIGALIISRKENKYRLNVGSDTCFPVALSRCLTEILQGMNTNADFLKNLLLIPRKEHPYFLNDDEESRQKRYKEYLQFTINGMGVFPKTLFNSDESYQFNPDAFITCGSYKEEVVRLINLIQNMGHTVYLRDSSFLGFPTCYIYIPVVSPLGKKTYAAISFTDMHDADYLEDLFFTGSQKEKTDNGNQKAFLMDMKLLSSITHLLNKYPNTTLSEILRLEFTEDSPLSTMPISFVLTLFWYKLKNYTEAVRNLRLFMSASDNEEDEYYKTIVTFLMCKEKDLNDDLITAKMKKAGHDRGLITEIIETFNDDKKLFSGIQFPVCPDCHCCQLQEQCVTKNKVELSKRLHTVMHPVVEKDVVSTLL